MIFSSSIFLVYFLPVFLLVYFFLRGKKLKNAFLLVSSILFYSWGAPKFIFAILATTTLDFYLVKIMSNANYEKRKKLFLILSLCLNVGMLFYFKYCNFFIENFNSILGMFGAKQIEWTKIVLPIGISFYTFESLTYVIDVYRGVHKPLKNFWHYQMYILLFPKLIAGPIIRYHEISDQIDDRSNNETLDNKIGGFMRFALGLSKKVLIANVMAAEADRIFSIPLNDLGTSTAWLGMLAYTFQIYFDFSGYSDMAIGIGKMIGFKFPENFDNPYTSSSITEFWRRWHMTLGNWMRNYLYIPLGGNKVNSKLRLYVNLWLVFIASGFWHGASWAFIFWGIYHGLFLVLERAFLLKVYAKLGKLPSVIITFLLVAIGWVFFRSTTLSEGWNYTKKLFSFKNNSLFHLNLGSQQLFYVALFFSFFMLIPKAQKLQNYFYTNSSISTFQAILFPLLSVFLFALCLGAISSSGFNPFIYFRF
jgi:alginate O-acetyltransferase complex protein AlgI